MSTPQSTRSHSISTGRSHPLLPFLALLTACAMVRGPDGLRPGDSLDAIQAQMGPPTSEYRSPDGGRRLEYARGPAGRQTFMLDLDAQGQLLGYAQVLNEKTFATVEPGMTVAEVRHTIGRPSRVWGVRYHQQTVWTYRFETTECLLFHVGITPAGRVEDAGYGPDPSCDPDDRTTPR